MGVVRFGVFELFDQLGVTRRVATGFGCCFGQGVDVFFAEVTVAELLCEVWVFANRVGTLLLLR